MCVRWPDSRTASLCTIRPSLSYRGRGTDAAVKASKGFSQSFVESVQSFTEKIFWRSAPVHGARPTRTARNTFCFLGETLWKLSGLCENPLLACFAAARTKPRGWAPGVGPRLKRHFFCPLEMSLRAVSTVPGATACRPKRWVRAAGSRAEAGSAGARSAALEAVVLAQHHRRAVRRSVAAIPAWRFDRRDRLQVEIDDRLQCFGGGCAMERLRQCFEPCGVVGL
jgi:hypothetical protein